MGTLNPLRALIDCEYVEAKDGLRNKQKSQMNKGKKFE
jgi:hypothetical protein